MKLTFIVPYELWSTIFLVVHKIICYGVELHKACDYPFRSSTMTGSRNFYEINKKALADCCAMSYLGSSMFCDPDSVFSRTEADFLNELLTDANFSGCLCSHGKMDFSGAVDDSENEKDHCFDHAHQCRKWRAEILFIDRPNIPKFDENLCSDQHHHHHHHSFTYDDRRDRTAFENFYRPDQRRLTLDDLNNFYVDQNEYGKIPLLKKLINYAKVVRRKWINDYNCRPLDLMLIAMKNVRFARNLHAWFIIPMISDDLLEYLSDNRNILKNLLEIRQSNFSLNYDNKILNANLIAYVQYLTRLMNNSPYDAKNFRFPTSNLSRNPSFAAVVIKNPPLWAYFAFSFCLIGVPLCLLLSHVISCKSDAMRDTTRKKKSEIKWSQRKDNLRLSYGHVRLPSSPYFVNAHGMSNGAVSTKHRTTMKIMMFQHFRKSKCHPNEVKYI